MNKDDCVFCKIASGKIETSFISEDDNFFAIKDKIPRMPGHSLVIPKKHFETILEMPSELGQELLEFIKKVASQLIKEEEAEGFNIVMNNGSEAGQVVMHLHIHIIPRFFGDVEDYVGGVRHIIPGMGNYKKGFL